MLKNKINKKKFIEADSNTIAIISTIIILLGCFLFSYNYVKEKKIMAYTYMDNIFYTKEETHEENKVEQPTTGAPAESVEPTQEEKKVIEYNYIGYLEIPKIGLKKGFVSKDSRYNDVEKNIYIVPESSYPDVQGGNFMIAGHSGTGWRAFFNYLYKLNQGDEIIVTYNGNKYRYVIDNIYTQPKTGTIKILRDSSRTTLTLVTCTNNTEDSQTVYIAYQK